MSCICDCTARYAPQLWKFAQGIDERSIISESTDAKSYGHQETFNEDVTDEAFVLATLRTSADHLMAIHERLRSNHDRRSGFHDEIGTWDDLGCSWIVKLFPLSTAMMR